MLTEKYEVNSFIVVHAKYDAEILITETSLKQL